VDSTPEPALAARPGPDLRGVWLGRRSFADALALQLTARDELVAGGEPTLFLVEHPPVLTLGRRASPEDILWTDEQLAAAGVEVAETPRGGQVTLHAPGQLVAYPVVHVGRKIREHIVRLGRVATNLLAELGVTGHEFRMEHPGVWLGDRKLASIGIHVSRGVSIQGISLNLDVDPGLFAALVSCGLHGVEVTSATAVGGRKISVEAAARRFAELFAEDAGISLRW
jgi:lipoyl(octanoyl) transferase